MKKLRHLIGKKFKTRSGDDAYISGIIKNITTEYIFLGHIICNKYLDDCDVCQHNPLIRRTKEWTKDGHINLSGVDHYDDIIFTTDENN